MMTLQTIIRMFHALDGLFVKWWVISHCIRVEFSNCRCTATDKLSQLFELSVAVMFRSSCSVFDFISVSCDSNQYKGELDIFYIACCVTASTKREQLGSSLPWTYYTTESGDVTIKTGQLHHIDTIESANSAVVINQPLNQKRKERNRDKYLIDENKRQASEPVGIRVTGLHPGSTRIHENPEVARILRNVLETSWRWLKRLRTTRKRCARNLLEGRL